MRMMKKILLFVTFLLGCLPLMAQAPVCLEGAERGKAMASILKANDIRTSLQFRFVMTRHSALLTEALKSRGKAYYIYPDKVRWEVEQPRPSVFVLNGATTTDRRQQTLLRNVSKIAEKGLVNEADFTVKVYQTPGQWQVDLVPLRRDLGQLFSLLTLLADPDTGALRSIVLTETSGDITSLELNSLVKGQPLDEALFRQP